MRLCVIVTVVDGGDRLERCLDALAAQEGGPETQVVVPMDATLGDLAPWRRRYPAFTFLDLGPIETAAPSASAAGQHELFDRRRSAGLLATTADLVAVVEDRGAPRPDWAAAMVRAHARPHAVIGGAVDHANDALLNWAVFFCDFGRYQPPLPEGPAAWATDVNICYKRRALEATRDLWRERYHETTVHWALQRAGEVLYLDPAPVVVEDRGPLRLGPLLRERFAWGRLFAYTRAREVSTGRRLVYAAIAPLLPLLLLVRHARLQWRKRRTFGRFLAAAPAVLLLLCAWCFGECAGYLTRRP